MKNEGRTPHPRKDDLNEQRIREQIENEVYSTELGKKMFGQVYDLQVAYFKSSLGHLEDKNLIHDDTQKTLEAISIATNSQIVEGREVLENLPKHSPVMVVANHYGGFKLTMIEQEKIGLNVGTEKIDDLPPFPLYYAAFKPAANILEDNLYDAHLELPEPLLKIQEAAGLLVVPENNKAFPEIKRRTEEITKIHPNSMLVVFPEAGTSGKRNGGGPYNLDKFHSGSFAIAEELGLPLIPMAQYFNPQKGFEIKLFDRVNLDGAPGADNMDARREFFSKVSAETQNEMQVWLNNKSSNS
jgi:hypothetical protein